MEQRLIDANALEERFSLSCGGECALCSYNNTLCDIITEAPTVDAIPLLDNATNGDVIKALFSNIESIDAPLMKIYVMVYTKDHKCMRFDSDWWNAPYRKEQTD